MQKYLVAHNWNHCFEAYRNTEVRFVFCPVSNCITAMQVKAGKSWHFASKYQVADVQDSLKHSNEAIFDNPQDYGIEEVYSLPCWAS